MLDYATILTGLTLTLGDKTLMTVKGWPEVLLTLEWRFYQDRLHVEYQQTLLARYLYRLDRRSTQISSISHPKLYRTSFASPQLELLELDDAQWTKIARRPEYGKRRAALAAAARQLAFDFPLMSWLFCWL